MFCVFYNTRNIVSDVTQTPDEEARTLLLAASILPKDVLNHDSPFKFDGSFSSDCEESSIPKRMKYFFHQLLSGPSSSPEQETSRNVLSVSQVAMLNMTSLSANLNNKPLLPVFLAMKLHFETRSKKLVNLLHQYALSVLYKEVINIETKFAQAIADHTSKNDNVVCSINLRQHIFTVASSIIWIINLRLAQQVSHFMELGYPYFSFPHHKTLGLVKKVYDLIQ